MSQDFRPLSNVRWYVFCDRVLLTWSAQSEPQSTTIITKLHPADTDIHPVDEPHSYSYKQAFYRQAHFSIRFLFRSRTHGGGAERH